MCTLPADPDQISNANDVIPSFLLGVGIFDELQLGLRTKTLDFGEFHEIVDLLSIEFEVEAGVLECVRLFDYGLPKILDRFLGRDLAPWLDRKLSFGAGLRVREQVSCRVDEVVGHGLGRRLRVY